MMAAVTAPEPAGSSRRPLFWTCAVFAGGVLLNADRVPPWAAAVALLLIAWRLLSAYRGGGYPASRRVHCSPSRSWRSCSCAFTR